MRQNGLPYSSHLLLVALAVGLILASPPSARGEITGLIVLAAKDIGPFRGKAYREVEARMEGSAPGGTYAVPVTLAFPKEPSDHNGFAVVDVVNTHTVGNEQWVLGGQPFPLARIHMGDDFLFGTGNAYVEVMWDKKTVDMLGNGTIATPPTATRFCATPLRSPGTLRRFCPLTRAYLRLPTRSWPMATRRRAACSGAGISTT